MRLILAAACMLSLTSCGGGPPSDQTSNTIAVVPVGETVDDTASASNASAGTDEGPQPCDAIRGRLATPGDCREYARQRSALSDGVAAFSPPQNMPVGATQTVTLQIGAAADAADVVAATGGNAAATKRMDITLGDYVSAELGAPADIFEITPRGPVVKQLPDNRRQSWEWGLKPLVPGRHKLTLTIGVPAVGGASAPAFFLDPKVYDVEVSARPRTWTETADDAAKFFTSLKGMLVALAAVIAAASGVWLALRHFGKKPEKEGKDG